MGGLPTSCRSTPQASVADACGCELFEHHARVDPDVAFGMKLRRLRDALHARDFGQQDREQAGLVEQLEGRAARRLR